MQEYTKEGIHKAVLSEQEFFRTGATLDIDFRIEQLKKLKQMILKNEDAMKEALKQDL